MEMCSKLGLQGEDAMKFIAAQQAREDELKERAIQRDNEMQALEEKRSQQAMEREERAKEREERKREEMEREEKRLKMEIEQKAREAEQRRREAEEQ